MAEGISGLSDTVIRQVQYAIETKGDQALRDLKAALAAVNMEIGKASLEYAAGTISIGQYEARTQSLIRQQQDLSAQVRLAAAAMADGGRVTDRLVADLKKTEVATRSTGQGMQKFAYLLDDLQYVGEQGLRPILNNLAAINPLLGIAAITFAQIQKHADELKSFGTALGEHWGLIDATSQSNGLIDSLKKVASALGDVEIGGVKVKEALDFQGLGEGIDAMMKGQQRRDQAKIDAFMKEGTDADKQRGGALSKTIDNYGRGKAIEEIIRKRAEIDPSLRPGYKGDDGQTDADRRRQETARIIDMIQRSQKGDVNALGSLGLLTEGTGIGARIAETTPEAEKAKKEAEKKAREAAEAVEKQVKELSDDLIKGFASGFFAGDVVIDRPAVDAALAESGVQVPDSVADAIMAKIFEGYEKQVAERVHQKGLTREGAVADIREDLRRAEVREEDADQRADTHESPMERTARVGREKSRREAQSTARAGAARARAARLRQMSPRQKKAFLKSEQDSAIQDFNSGPSWGSSSEELMQHMMGGDGLDLPSGFGMGTPTASGFGGGGGDSNEILQRLDAIARASGVTAMNTGQMRNGVPAIAV